MAQHPSRPIKPEPWEVMQTDLGLKSKKTSDFKSWAFWSLLILGAFAVLAMMIIYLLPPRVPTVSTPKNTAIPTTYTATAEVPTALPENTPIATQDNQLPTSLPSIVLGKINAQSTSVNVYTNPSMDNINSTILETLESGHEITLIGRSIGQDRIWYQIEFSGTNGEKQLGWIFFEAVEVLHGDIESLPQPDSKVIVTPSPMPSLASTSLPEPSPTLTPLLVNCVYTIEPKDYLSTIADKFGIGGNNYKEITCVDNSLGCDLSIPAKIRPGWSVIVPGVKENICIQNSGQPQ